MKLNISVWRYKDNRNFQGINFYMQEKEEFLGIFQNMEQEGFSSKIVLKSKKPSKKLLQVVNANNNDIFDYEKLELIYKKDSISSIEEDNKILTITLNLELLKKFKIAIKESYFDRGFEIAGEGIIFWL